MKQIRDRKMKQKEIEKIFGFCMINILNIVIPRSKKTCIGK